MRTISPNENEAVLEHGADIAKAQMRLLLDGRRHLIVGRDAELAGAHQNAMTGRDFHAVAVACERRPDTLRSDVPHALATPLGGECDHEAWGARLDALKACSLTG